MVYRVLIEKGEDFGYVAHCPAIPGCHSQGDTIEEAIENIKDAIKSCIEALDKAFAVSKACYRDQKPMFRILCGSI